MLRPLTRQSTRAALLVALILLASCGGAASSGSAGGANTPEALVAGTLDPDTLPARPVVFGPQGVSAFGQAELPAGSRLQAAFALTDAAARAELARLLETRISTLTFAHVTEAETDARRLCLERAQAALPGLTIGARGARAAADGTRLRVASRVDLTPAEAEALLGPVFATAGPTTLAAAVRHLTREASDAEGAK